MLRKLLRDTDGNFIEDAFTLPILLLLSLGLVNLALFGTAGVTAANAANYGARMGSVAQTNPAGVAVSAAQTKLSAVPLGDYQVGVSASGIPGSPLQLTVTYAIPNYFQGMASFFGVGSPATLSGRTRAYFRQEGW